MRINVARPHWSYSSVSQFLKCPLQFFFERVAKLPRTTTTDAQALGSSLHDALAHYHRKLQVNEPVTNGEVHRAFLDAWEEKAEDGQVIAAGEKSLENSRDLGLALVDVYLKEPPPESIIAVETPLLAPIANTQGEYLEKPILVVADLIVRQADGTLQVVELKTAGRAYSESEVATSLQPTFYANSVFEMTGEEPAVEFTVLVKTRVPKVQKIEAIRTVSDYRRLGDVIRVVERAVEAGAFYPVESPINCSGCPYYRPCREWTGSRILGELVPTRTGEVVEC